MHLADGSRPKTGSITDLFNFTPMVQLSHSIPLLMSNRHNIAIANLFRLTSIESGRKSLVFQNTSSAVTCNNPHPGRLQPVMQAFSGACYYWNSFVANYCFFILLCFFEI